MKVLQILLLFSLAAINSKAANILIMHPIYCGSHEFVLRALGDVLISRGHSVTQIRFKHKNSHIGLKTNVTVVTLDIVDKLENCGRFIDDSGGLDITKVGAKILWNEGHSVLGLPTDIFCLTDAHCHTLFNSQEVSQLLNQTTFDLVIVDFIANECSLAMASSLGVPMVGFWGFSFHGGEVAYTSTFNPPSLHPSFFSGLMRKMNFLSRVRNFSLHLFHRLYANFQNYYAGYYIAEKFPNAPPAPRLVHDLDLILVNTNEFVDYPKLLPPNVIQIGGFHLNHQVQQPLPQIYKDFIEDAEHGVILFSLGYTGFSASDIPKNVILALLESFASIDQRVIMRFDKDVLPYIPNNVMVSNWVPQVAILAHQNTVAFFSHCGISSVMESIFYGVPMIAVGIFADQVDNAAFVEDFGVAVRLSKDDLDDASLISHALRQICENSTYGQNARRISSMWHDRLLSPQSEAIYWIETLVKYGNLRHLRIEDHDLPLWKYFSLDVILFISTLFIFQVIFIISLARRYCRCQFLTRKKIAHCRPTPLRVKAE